MPHRPAANNNIDPRNGGATDTLRELLTYRLARITARLNAHATRLLSETAGLSLTKWRVLVVLDSLGPVPPTEIARRTAIDKGQLSRTIKDMVADGLLESEERKSDHRSHLLSMTRAGRTLFKKAKPVMRARQDRLRGGMTEAEREVLMSALDAIDQVIDDMEQD